MQNHSSVWNNLLLTQPLCESESLHLPKPTNVCHEKRHIFVAIVKKNQLYRSDLKDLVIVLISIWIYAINLSEGSESLLSIPFRLFAGTLQCTVPLKLLKAKMVSRCCFVGNILDPFLAVGTRVLVSDWWFRTPKSVAPFMMNSFCCAQWAVDVEVLVI